MKIQKHEPPFARTSPDEELLLELVKDARWHPDLAMNPNLPPSLQDFLCATYNQVRPRGRFILQHPDETLMRLAEHPHLHPSIQWRIAHGPIDNAKWALASREDLHSSLVPLLARDGGARARSVLAQRPELDAETFAILLDHPDVHGLCMKNKKAWKSFDLPARTLWTHAPDRLKRQVRGYPWEAVEALAPTWSGNVQSLLEAIELTSR